MHEFATRGAGTPLPYDPPTKLVTSGPYAYVANPMQIAATLILLVLASALHSWWIAGAGVIAHVYSTGVAAWDEHDDLTSRFGERWATYRHEVHDWIPRWRPWIYEPATLYVSATCEMCSEVKRWFEGRGSVGLQIVEAERSPRPLHRLTYVHANGSSEEGVVAIARALEHLHLGWAYIGWGMRLPLVHQALQLLVDAVGGGARTLATNGVSQSVAQ